MDFENVRRAAVVIKVKTPLSDWLKSMDPESPQPDLDLTKEIYLVEDFETEDDLKKWLKKNFDLIFKHQLNNWYTDESLWVKNRNFRMFEEWFDYSFYPMIWDTLSEDIDKD